MTTITRARVYSTASLVRCDLARARRRAGISLAKLHREDEAWRAALARDYYAGAMARWAEFVRGRGESRAVARYEFLADFDAWIHTEPVPVDYGAGNADLYIVGMFGTDAILVSEEPNSGGRRRSNKFYRILRNTAQEEFSPLLRLPRTESLFMPSGDEAVSLAVSETGEDRLVCGFDTIVVVAKTSEAGLVFRVVRPGEKLLISPDRLREASDSFVEARSVLKQAKSAIRAMASEKSPAARAATRIYRMVPKDSDQAPTAKKDTDSTVIVAPATSAVLPGRLEADPDQLVKANAALLNHQDSVDTRTSIGTALRLAQTVVMMCVDEVAAIESVAREISERQAAIIEAEKSNPSDGK